MTKKHLAKATNYIVQSTAGVDDSWVKRLFNHQIDAMSYAMGLPNYLLWGQGGPITRENSVRIRCAACNRLVDKVHIDKSLDTRITTISVECHGEWDKMVLTDQVAAELGKDVVDGIMNGTTEGTAFTGEFAYALDVTISINVVKKEDAE